MPPRGEATRERLRKRVAAKRENLQKYEEREAHVRKTKRDITEMKALAAQAEALISEVDRVADQIREDEAVAGDTKTLALNKLYQQRENLQRNISGWEDAIGTLETHLKDLT